MRDLEVLRQCQRWVDEAGSANGDDPRIFRLGAAQIGRRIARACAQAGLLGEFSGHSPRVGMAVRMARRGAPLQAIQRQGRSSGPDDEFNAQGSQADGRSLRKLPLSYPSGTGPRRDGLVPCKDCLGAGSGRKLPKRRFEQFLPRIIQLVSQQRYKIP